MVHIYNLNTWARRMIAGCLRSSWSVLWVLDQPKLYNKTHLKIEMGSLRWLGGCRHLLQRLMTWVWSWEPAWWKERADSWKLCWMCLTHTFNPSTLSFEVSQVYLESSRSDPVCQKNTQRWDDFLPGMELDLILLAVVSDIVVGWSQKKVDDFTFWVLLYNLRIKWFITQIIFSDPLTKYQLKTSQTSEQTRQKA